MSDIFEPSDDDIPFTPVPVRGRRDGWTEARQRAFIRGVRQIGSASAAARAVGKSRRSAYKLRERPGAESFAAAWDEAIVRGFHNLQDHVIDRALHGAVVPRFRRGRQVGLVHRFYDGVAVAVLSGRGVNRAEQLKQSEDRGARQSFFDIERAWRRDLNDLNAERDRRIAAEEKLAKATLTWESTLANALEFGRRRRGPETGLPHAGAPEEPSQRPTRPVPRIRLL